MGESGGESGKWRKQSTRVAWLIYGTESRRKETKESLTFVNGIHFRLVRTCQRKYLYTLVHQRNETSIHAFFFLSLPWCSSYMGVLCLYSRMITLLRHSSKNTLYCGFCLCKRKMLSHSSSRDGKPASAFQVFTGLSLEKEVPNHKWLAKSFVFILWNFRFASAQSIIIWVTFTSVLFTKGFVVRLPASNF